MTFRGVRAFAGAGFGPWTIVEGVAADHVEIESLGHQEGELLPMNVKVLGLKLLRHK